MANKIFKESRDRLCLKTHGSGFGKLTLCKMSNSISNDLLISLGFLDFFSDYRF